MNFFSILFREFRITKIPLTIVHENRQNMHLPALGSFELKNSMDYSTQKSEKYVFTCFETRLNMKIRSFFSRDELDILPTY